MSVLRDMVGYACLGAFYQCAKKALKSDSVIGSAFYSSLAGLFGKGAHGYFFNQQAQQELDHMLQDPQANSKSRDKLRDIVLRNEGRGCSQNAG